MISAIKKKKKLQHHYISDKSEHAYTFEQKKSELHNQSKVKKLTSEIYIVKFIFKLDFVVILIREQLFFKIAKVSMLQKGGSTCGFESISIPPNSSKT